MIELLYKYLIAPMMAGGYRLAALINPKAREFFRIREDMFERLEREAGDDGRFRIMVHVASAGELLEARPVLRALRSCKDPPYLVLSYTSPSLTDKLLKDSADLVTPSPLDTPGRVKRFLNLVRPDLVVWSSYDVWPALAWEAHARNIPLFLVNARLPAVSGRYRFPARLLFSRVYSRLQAVGAIDDDSARRFRHLGVPSATVSVTGNCRFDETLARCRSVAVSDPDLRPLPDNELVLILASTWPQDHERVLPALAELLEKYPGLSAVVAPHEPSDRHLAEIEDFLQARNIPHQRYRSLREEGKQGDRVVVVDTVGVLYKLYKKGHAAYVGGSFQQGVHNVMEPAGMGLPVLTGPVHHNSPEAERMIEQGGAYEVRGSEDVVRVVSGWMDDPSSRERAGQKALDMIQQSAGATRKTMELLSEHLPQEENAWGAKQDENI
ncbi:MAG: glycosyltransferase N-terminal domain-containing protein [bacterium]